MSKQNKNSNGRRGQEVEVPDVALDLPENVHNANWRDDIPEEVKEENEAIDFEPFEDEQGYLSQEYINAHLEERIKRFRQGRLRDEEKVSSTL